MSVDLPYSLRPIGAPPAPRPDEIVAVMVVRNEALRLGDALRHARQNGVGTVLLIDNGSTDATCAIAACFPRVHVIEAPGDYASSQFGIHWINAVLDAYARDHWALMLDADEQLVFPGSDQAGALPALCRHLDRIGAEGMQALMLDLFPTQPLHATRYDPAMPLIEAAGWFEPPQLRTEAVPDFPHVAQYGGLRERLFFPEADPSRLQRLLWQKAYNLGLRVPLMPRSKAYRRLAPPRSPNLTKVPLVRWRKGAAFLTAHSTTPLRFAAEQPSGVLLHFKFLQDFHARVMDAVTRNAHFDNSSEYHRYLQALRQNPDFTLHGPLSRRYIGPAQLVRYRLLRDTPAWVRERQQAFVSV